ncbi:MAG: galactokinase [Flaviaesturariibacter sp.]|nr:galactokinase [Flaviaesturariibacter sp.]
MLPSLIARKTFKKYQELYSVKPLVSRSPGRVNIIGEHTDYNEGFVLPAAIDKAVYVAVGKRGDDRIELHSIEFNSSYKTALSEIAPREGQWTNYVLGVVAQIVKRGHSISGFNLVIDGEVPFGAGLSSSAAVECATAFALNELFGLHIPKEELIFIAQKAEHEYAKVMCGIMDQFASMFGKKDHVVKLDCKTMDYEYVPLKLEGYKILLLNTNVKHSLSSTEYNVRREQCEKGAAMVKKHHPEVNSLRDATLEMLDKYVASSEPLIYQRCKYVVEEKRRLLEGCEDLKAGNIVALGQKMFQTHDGLSKLYEVSCKELDFLVDAVRDNPEVLGSRMMGGGFGGCTINIVKEEAIDSLITKLSTSYSQAMGLELTPYIAIIEDGTSLVNMED